MSAHRFAGEVARTSYVAIRGWDRCEIKPLLECINPFISGALAIEDIEEYARDSLDFALRYLRGCPDQRDPHGLNLQQIAALNVSPPRAGVHPVFI